MQCSLKDRGKCVLGDDGRFAVTDFLCLENRKCDETVLRGTEKNGFVGDGGRCVVTE